MGSKGNPGGVHRVSDELGRIGSQKRLSLDHLGYQKEHLDQLVKLVATGRLDVSRSVSEVMPLEQVAHGVERLAKKEGNPIRLVVAP